MDMTLKKGIQAGHVCARKNHTIIMQHVTIHWAETQKENTKHNSHNNTLDSQGRHHVYINILNIVVTVIHTMSAPHPNYILGNNL